MAHDPTRTPVDFDDLAHRMAADPRHPTVADAASHEPDVAWLPPTRRRGLRLLPAVLVFSCAALGAAAIVHLTQTPPADDPIALSSSTARSADVPAPSAETASTTPDDGQSAPPVLQASAASEPVASVAVAEEAPRVVLPSPMDSGQTGAPPLSDQVSEEVEPFAVASAGDISADLQPDLGSIFEGSPDDGIPEPRLVPTRRIGPDGRDYVEPPEIEAVDPSRYVQLEPIVRVEPDPPRASVPAPRQTREIREADEPQLEALASLPSSAPEPVAAPRQAAAPSTAAVSGPMIQISTSTSEERALSAFPKYVERFSEIIGSPEPVIRHVSSSTSNPYRLQIGPYENSREASAICARLRAAGGDCFVVN